MIILALSMETEQNFVARILIVLSFTLKPDFFEDISNDVIKWFDTSNFNKMIKYLFQ